MKTTILLLLTTLSTLLLAAEPNAATNDQNEASYCHLAGDRYSPGAIIKQGNSMYRCVVAFDDDLEHLFVWVRIPETNQNGSEISIYWQ